MIYVDSREDDPVKKILFDNFECEEKTLDVGDIIVSNYCCERKTIGDFVQSYFSQHIAKQLYQQEISEYQSILILEGEYDDYFLKSKNLGFQPILYDTFIKMKISLLQSLPKLKIIEINSTQALIPVVQKLQLTPKQLNVEILKHSLIKSDVNNDDIQAAMVSCIPGIGFDKAKAILKVVPFNKLQSASEVDLKQVEGIGSKTAAKIKEVFKNEE